ncbi:hypothetical protein G7Y89_g9266 [Cudoniella acicularis]|uniref:Uncharacterized protein n=1 Tax=Cudoniella acicularis TaxID=354080 RepID=A0A8H4RIP1_9HELO|nr:hypothetical protein G7Y89_g9266 [Cudoniella acicularis]
MEDPWSSPWAEDVQPPKTHNEKAINDAATRPRTPIRTTSLALQQHTGSPWDDGDDDEFGGWAAVPSDVGIGLDGANDTWEGNPTDTSAKPLKEVTNEFSVGWDQSPTLAEEPISKLAPSLLPKSTDIPRQPSPDPWAFESESEPRNNTELDERKINQGEIEELAKSKNTGDIGHIEGLSRDDQTGVGELEQLPAQEDTETEEPPVENALSENPSLSGVEIDNSLDHSSLEQDTVKDEVAVEQMVEDVVIEQPIPIPERPSTPQLDYPTSSRSSLSPSEHSHHEIFSDSPRTSLEDEPRRPHMPRQVSKVKELVEHFDTLAKMDEDSETINGRSSLTEGRDEKSQGSEDDMDDFGDFEEGQSDDDEELAAQTSPDLSIPKTRPVESSNIQEATSPPPTEKKDLGPVEFKPDISLLAKIYQDSESETPEKIFIPDTISHDSFTTTEERKIWYRVSRYGPMRKHNTRDDENYVRVNWLKSQVRVETLKTVARWIEEDRMSGHVVLGGASKAGSIFGWNDTKSKPASISAAFASKNATKKPEVAPVDPATEIPREWPKGLVRDRSTSTRRSSVKSVKSPEETKSKQSPVATFGWNTTPENSNRPQSRPPTTKRPSGSISSIVSVSNGSSPKHKRSSSSRQSSISSPTKTIPANDAPQRPVSPIKVSTTLPPKPLLQKLTPAPALKQLSNDDDDDWGEMVSSPAVTAPPVLPPSNRLRHKKSQSFGGVAPAVAFSNTPESIPRSSLQSIRSHRPKVSFDQILTPESWSPQSANPSRDASATSMNVSNNIFSHPQQTLKPVPPPTPSSGVDPWASADFSFFESTPTAPSIPAAAAVPQPIPTQTGSIPSKTVSFANTRAMAPPPIASNNTPGTGKPKDEMEQDRIVQAVVKGLPNLSYMLKR